MQEIDPRVLQGIPQRPPFLFVDKILSFEHKNGLDVLVTEKTFSGKEDFFQGHFPGHPVTPGVLLSECTFQSGALLMSQKNADGKCPLAYVTRITMTKFKNVVTPPAILTIEVTLVEQLAQAYFMRGKIMQNGKLMMQNEFTCTVVEN